MINGTYTLANGVKIPKIGYGTWMIPNDQAAENVNDAIKLGYRHIDTAEAYGNEEGVGVGVRMGGVPREEIFLTTKLDASYKDYDSAKKAIAESLAKLDLDYIDLMLIHSPRPWDEYLEDDNYFSGNVEAWRALEEAYQSGKIKAIGVSNFDIQDIDNLIKNGKVKPMVNQVLAHIGNTPFEIIDYSKRENILVEAYSPIAHGNLLKTPEIEKMALKYDTSLAQLAIGYLLQLGLLPLPKTMNEEHMRLNADINFEISASDMETLKNMNSFDYGKDADQFEVFKKTLK